jgi:hypothetical protein
MQFICLGDFLLWAKSAPRIWEKLKSCIFIFNLFYKYLHKRIQPYDIINKKSHLSFIQHMKNRTNNETPNIHYHHMFADTFLQHCPNPPQYDAI